MADPQQDQRDLPKSTDSDEDIIADARRYLEWCNQANGDNYAEGLRDLQMLAGQHWPDKEAKQRELDGRPCLTINKLPTFLHQVTNEQRQNRTSIKVSPVGSDADRFTAEVFQGIIKHIEYSSNADIAKDTAVNSAAAIGFGYWRILPRYCAADSFDQELAYERIRNSFTVAYDPSSQQPDGSDQHKCMIHTKLAKEVFLQQYPGATATPLGLESSAGLAEWVSDKEVRVAEFYRIEREPAKLVKLSDGGVMYKDELPENLPDDITIIAERDTTKNRVMWYKLTALEVLERTEIKCKWIPVFPVFGVEIDLDGKVVRHGLIRNARDPSLMYDYWMTGATEEVAMRPKTPFIGAVGQFETSKTKWQQANNRSFPFVEYDPVTVDGQLAPPPQRSPMADIPNGMLTMAMHANDNIKATTGLFDSSLGAVGNATSGRQELAQQHQGNTANFHYHDGLTRSERHCARCIVDMIPNYYDTQRVVQIMRDDETIHPVEINKPLNDQEKIKEAARRQAMTPAGQEPPPVPDVLHDLSAGKYGIVVDSGPSYLTMRKEAADAMIQFGQSWPKLMDVAGDKVVKAMDWPGAEEIAARIERMIPPELRYDPRDPNAGPPPLPPAVKQQMDQMQQFIQQLQQENQELKSGIDKVQIKAQSDERIAAMQGQMDQVIAQIAANSRADVEEIKGYVAFLLAKMQPPEALATDVTQDIANETTSGS